MTEVSINLADGDAYPLKGTTDVGTADVKDEEVMLSSFINRLSKRVDTNFA